MRATTKCCPLLRLDCSCTKYEIIDDILSVDLCRQKFVAARGIKAARYVIFPMRYENSLPLPVNINPRPTHLPGVCSIHREFEELSQRSET